MPSTLRSHLMLCTMRFFSLIFCLFSCCVSFAATIRGSVKDRENGEALTGAVVMIRELRLSTIAGFDGSFELKGVPAGDYDVEISFISYRPGKIRIVLAEKESAATLKVELISLSTTIDEITVVTTQDKSSEASARNAEREAASVMNAVSAKAIELSPDLNVANVLQRMSGMTLDKSGGNGAQYALLRGMDKRYNYTLVNGIKIPSTNSKHRYVPLDIFPADLVDRIEVTKAITPDMEGDAIAGVVNLVMKNAPERLLVQANASAGYSQFFADVPLQTFDRSAVNLQSPYEANPAGYNAVPEDFGKKNLDIHTVNVPVNAIAGLTLGNRFFNKKLGVLVCGNFQLTHRGTRSILFQDDLSRDGQNLPILTDFEDRTYYETQRNTGLHTKLDYHFNSRHHLRLYVADVRYNTTQLRSNDETSLEVSYAPEKGFETRTHSDRFRYNLQELFNATFQGEHGLGPKFSVNWSAVYSRATNATPDEATISYATSLENFKQVPGFIDFGGSTRRWRSNTDGDLAGYLNFKYSLTGKTVKTELSGGGLYRMKTRSSFYNSYTLIPYNPNRPPDSSLYSAKDRDWRNYSDIQWTVRNPRGSVGTSENFDASEDVMAAYSMAKLNFRQLQVIGGLRVEQTLQGYSMLFPAGEKRPTETYSYVDLLPGLHLRYTIKGRHNLRMCYYRATNKPGFQEIVPFIVRGDDYSSAGNPDLKQAVADNIDMRWEYFSDNRDQVMAGLFYKNIRDAIEYAFVDYLGNSHEQVYSPVNSDKALNYGLELDVTKYRRQFGIKANYTWTRSNINSNKLSRVKTARGEDSTAYVTQSRPLFGQSAHVGNVSLLYMGSGNGLSAQLAFSYTGDRLYTVSRYVNNDLWQKGFWQMDFSCEKRFKKGLSVFAKAQNLLNTKVIVYIRNTNPANADKPWHSNSDKTTLVRSEYSKPMYLAGLRYKI